MHANIQLYGNDMKAGQIFSIIYAHKYVYANMYVQIYVCANIEIYGNDMEAGGQMKTDLL